jgi:hypothetical protein
VYTLSMDPSVIWIQVIPYSGMNKSRKNGVLHLAQCIVTLTLSECLETKGRGKSEEILLKRAADSRKSEATANKTKKEDEPGSVQWQSVATRQRPFVCLCLQEKNPG